LKVAVVRFPGSNCDLDAVEAIGRIRSTRIGAELVWHEDGGLGSFDAVVLPGGFSFGDCLRAGSIAARSPAISAIRRLSDRGIPILGICNGFQILVESGLLPGALLRNSGLKFVCDWTSVRVENENTPFTGRMRRGQILRMPIAHGEGRYFAPEDEIKRMESDGRIVFRYTDSAGRVTRESNPTGTSHGIAGISNEDGNVVGLMPHPERACDPAIGPFASDDGRLVFESLLGGGGR